MKEPADVQADMGNTHVEMSTGPLQSACAILTMPLAAELIKAVYGHEGSLGFANGSANMIPAACMMVCAL